MSIPISIDPLGSGDVIYLSRLFFPAFSSFRRYVLPGSFFARDYTIKAHMAIDGTRFEQLYGISFSLGGTWGNSQATYVQLRPGVGDILSPLIWRGNGEESGTLRIYDITSHANKDIKVEATESSLEVIIDNIVTHNNNLRQNTDLTKDFILYANGQIGIGTVIYSLSVFSSAGNMELLPAKKNGQLGLMDRANNVFIPQPEATI